MDPCADDKRLITAATKAGKETERVSSAVNKLATSPGSYGLETARVMAGFIDWGCGWVAKPDVMMSEPPGAGAGWLLV